MLFSCLFLKLGKLEFTQIQKVYLYFETWDFENWSVSPKFGGRGEWGIILIVQSVVIFDMIKEVCIAYRKPARALPERIEFHCQELIFFLILKWGKPFERIP